MEGKTFWLSTCKKYGIIETLEGCFEPYFRLYSTLGNHNSLWFNNYTGAFNNLKKEHYMESRMKKVSKEEFENAILA